VEVIPAGAEHAQWLETLICRLRTHSAIKQVHICTGSLASLLHQRSPSFPPLSIFKPLARTRLYHSVHQEHNRKINFSEQMSPGKRRGSREDVFSGRGSKEGRQGPTNSRGSGEHPNVDGDPEKTPKTRGSRKGLRGIQGRPSTLGNAVALWAQSLPKESSIV
jgi:hypothetical protein